jgi:hypothetical protein
VRPDAPAPETALAELARRYLGAFGPAAPRDLASWSGLPMTSVRAGWSAIAGELEEVATPAGRAWTLAGALPRRVRVTAGEPVVRLLPAFDTFLLGYRDRTPVVAAAHARHVHPGGGIVRPTVLVDGHAAATWRARTRGGVTHIVAIPFEALDDRRVRAGLAAEAGDVGRFLDTEATLTIAAAR